MDNKPNLNIPLIFQKGKTFEADDTRFMSVKIWLMHLNENLNGSYFEKEVVESAISTLANTPILAYIEDTSDGENDFSDHRQVLVKENGNFKIKYIGQAIGVIPESNNAQFEMRLCDDGIEREFLTVEGLVWQNKWDDAPDILDRDKIKAESMEIHDDYTGQFEDDKLYHFKSFKFYGACGLGKSVLPAMQNATIEVNFTFDDFQKEIQEKMEQFKKFSLNNQSSFEVDNIDTQILEKGGKQIVDKKLEILKKFNLTVEQLKFNIEEVSLEELEGKISEQFSLSNNQLMTEINKILQTKTEIRETYWGELRETNSFYLMDLKDNNAIVVTYDWDTYYGIPYTENGDVVALDFEAKVEYIPDWRPKQAGDTSLFTNVKEIITSEFTIVKESTEVTVNEANEKFTIVETEKNELQTKFDTLSNDFELVKPEFEKLKEFEKQTLEIERKESESALFEQFSELEGNTEFELLKTKSSEYELDNLEKECFAILGKKNAKFTSKPAIKKEKVKIEFSKKDDEPVGEFDELFNKYLNKNKEEI